LWNASDGSIEAFAEEWGPLRIKADGRVDESLYGIDSLDAWRFFAGRANAVLQLAISLKEEKPGRERNWRYLSTPHDSKNEPDKFYGLPNWPRRELIDPAECQWGEQLSIARKRSILASEISAWMQLFTVSLGLEWKTSGGWGLTINFRGHLLAAIGYQLALKISDGRLFRCSGCGGAYIRMSQKPKRGLGNYCRKCSSADAGKKAADERRRWKIHEARRMHAAGVSYGLIAERLHVRDTTKRTKAGVRTYSAAETIRRWVAKGK
jgi:hypothetical protein